MPSGSSSTATGTTSSSMILAGTAGGGNAKATSPDLEVPGAKGVPGQLAAEPRRVQLTGVRPVRWRGPPPGRPGPVGGRESPRPRRPVPWPGAPDGPCRSPENTGIEKTQQR